MQATEREEPRVALAIRRELYDYQHKRPGRVPPADSPSRPGLARLWDAAFSQYTKRKNLKTFTYRGHRYGVIFIDHLLCVMDWKTRRVLVKPPSSMAALTGVLGNEKAVYQ
jgi:hypothetical protein